MTTRWRTAAAGALATVVLVATPAARADEALTARHAAHFADDLVEVHPAREARRWHLPFDLADRSSLSQVGVISGLGAYRASYVRGHLHTGADLVPRQRRGRQVEVRPLAGGAVCSVHLGPPHATVVLKHRLPGGETLYTSYKHLAEIDVAPGQQVGPDTRIGRLYTRQEARALGGNYDHLHLEVRRRFDDLGAASWTTMSVKALRARFVDPVAFLESALSTPRRGGPPATAHQGDVLDSDLAADVLDSYMAVDQPVADGFDLPVARAARGQQVRAVGAGRVLLAGEVGDGRGAVVVVQHLYYENHRKKRLQSLYAHLERVEVRAGQEVARGQRLGTLGDVPAARQTPGAYLELRQDETQPISPRLPEASAGDAGSEPCALPAQPFVAARRQLVVPQAEPCLLLVDQASYRLRHYAAGTLRGEYDVALGQAAGRKRVRGDLRTPKGMYFVVEKSRGPFTGPYGAYYGGYWIKVNFPNAFDADHGVQRGLISAQKRDAIARAWQARAPTWQGSPLGSGIGLHGWASEWDGAATRHLSWGCVVLHPSDIATLFEQVPVGAAVVIR